MLDFTNQKFTDSREKHYFHILLKQITIFNSSPKTVSNGV